MKKMKEARCFVSVTSLQYSVTIELEPVRVKDLYHGT